MPRPASISEILHHSRAQAGRVDRPVPTDPLRIEATIPHRELFFHRDPSQIADMIDRAWRRISERVADQLVPLLASGQPFTIRVDRVQVEDVANRCELLRADVDIVPVETMHIRSFLPSEWEIDPYGPLERRRPQQQTQQAPAVDYNLRPRRLIRLED